MPWASPATTFRRRGDALVAARIQLRGRASLPLRPRSPASSAPTHGAHGTRAGGPRARGAGLSNRVVSNERLVTTRDCHGRDATAGHLHVTYRVAGVYRPYTAAWPLRCLG